MKTRCYTVLFLLMPALRRIENDGNQMPGITLMYLCQADNSNV
jgi:hypothetical protein